ncbi:MAG TPA: alpha/beta fold hydrolase [Chloroflexia bacterium]|nr:alpha/beta fold hydrolase [Chloroflexia bacterium]
MIATLTRTRQPGSSTHGADEHNIEVEGVSLRYLEAGAEHGGIPILMLHGLQGGADLWLPHPLPALAERFHVIAPDLPGFGDSGMLSSYGMGAYTTVMLAFMDALGHARFNLIGHSLGAQIAITMAAMQPERVNRLLVADGSGLPQGGPRWLNPVKLLTDASSWHFKLYPKVFRLARKSRAFREGLQALQRDYVTDRLRDVTMPTLVVWGSRDRVAPLEHGAFLAKHIPHARLAIIRGAGHMPFYERPAQFMKLAEAFFSAGRGGEAAG